MTLWNCAYDFAFSLTLFGDKDGPMKPTANELRNALIERATSLKDEELIEACECRDDAFIEEEEGDGEEKYEGCEARDADGFICTLKPNHEGPHEARGTNHQLFGRWE